MNMANGYIDRGLGINDIVNILHIPRCIFYWNGSNEKPMEKLLSREFVCYGYKKIAKQLNGYGYIINMKKVMRGYILPLQRKMHT